MSLETKAIPREFIIEKSNICLTDPDPSMSVDKVQQFYAALYPELTVASVHKAFKDDKQVYTFKSVIGTKG